MNRPGEAEPASQATPPRREPDDHDRTTYRPRPAPPLADEGSDRTHWQPLARSGHSAGSTGAQPPTSAGSLPPLVHADQVPTYAQPAQGRRRFELPVDRFAAPVEQRARERAKLPIKGIITWTLVLSLVAIAAGVIWVRYLRTVDEDVTTKLPENSSSSALKVARGDEVVRQFLTALSQGDTDSALALGPTTAPGSRTLITKRAYAASLKIAAISEIQVPQAPETATEIPASYKLGTEQVTTKFRVAKQDNGSWQLVRTTAAFRPVGTSVQNVPLRINGVAVDWDTALELLPGSYTMSTGLPFIAFDATDTLTVLHLNYPDQSDHSMQPKLTPVGRNALIEAARRSLTQCVSRRELAPANCPMAVETPPRMLPGSARWTLVNDPWASANPGLNGSDQSRADVTVNLNLKLSLQFQGSGQSTTPVNNNATVSAVMTGSTVDQVRIEWRVN